MAVYTVPDAPWPIFSILLYFRLGSPTLTMVRSFSRISSSDIFFFLVLVRCWLGASLLAVGVVVEPTGGTTVVAAVVVVVVVAGVAVGEDGHAVDEVVVVGVVVVVVEAVCVAVGVIVVGTSAIVVAVSGISESVLLLVGVSGVSIV